MMQSIEVLLVYWILAQVNSLGFIGRMQFTLCLRQELLVNLLCFHWLAPIAIHHKVKHRDLISKRVAKIDLNVSILFHMQNLQIFTIMLPQQWIPRDYILRLVSFHATK